MQIYVVKQGDTIDSIASGTGSDAGRIAYDNQIVYPYRLAVGQALLLFPEGSSVDEGRRQITANGYAYPFISRYTLEETLPYLTYLSVFSYGFSQTGELIPPSLPDEWMIREALNRGSIPILTLTPFGPDGQFNNYLISAIVNDYEAQYRLITDLVRTMQQKGFGGVDVDFEYILAQDKTAFVQFVVNLSEVLRRYGYTVSVALAPKVSDTQRGLLYEGKDYAMLGEAADSVLLMTYEWGYTYSSPMAVAPINKVREVLDYAASRIPAYKTDMGIPNYGYDWPLPYERGVTKAKTIGNVEAVQIAIENGAVIQFDGIAMSPWFRYVQNGTEHEVWFEDVRSLRAKFELLQEYGLRGAGYWQIMQLFRANWLLLDATYRIRKTDV